VLAATAFLSWLTPDTLYFAHTYPIPIRANPYVLTSSVLGTTACFGLLYYLTLRSPRRRKELVTLFVAPTLIAVGAFVASLSPAQGSLVQRDQVYPVPVPRQQSFAVSFLFDNAKDSLSASELKRLKDEIDIFDSCAPSSPSIRGFASSAPYAANSDEQNKALANRRAFTVADALQGAFNVKPTIVQWTTYDEMRSARRIRDVDDSSTRRMSANERLNRRVEMFWKQESCMGSATGT
jgi:outer membrane protein OmpA-like peptidoglycan-associated protein